MTWWLGGSNYLLTCSLRSSLRRLWSNHNWRSKEETEWKSPLKRRPPVGEISSQRGRGSTGIYTSRCEVGWCAKLIPRRKLGRVHWDGVSHGSNLATRSPHYNSSRIGYIDVVRCREDRNQRDRCQILERMSKLEVVQSAWMQMSAAAQRIQ